jgi:hypothetical protein
VVWQRLCCQRLRLFFYKLKSKQKYISPYTIYFRIRYRHCAAAPLLPRARARADAVATAATAATAAAGVLAAVALFLGWVRSRVSGGHLSNTHAHMRRREGVFWQNFIQLYSSTAR